MQVFLGIDFGTTNTAAALNIDGVVRVLRLNNSDGKEKTLRSVIFISPTEEILFGQAALEAYLETALVEGDSSALDRFSTIDDKGNVRFWEEGLAAYLERQPKRGRLMQSFKSFLASSRPLNLFVAGKRYDIEDLVAILLRYIKEMAEAQAGHPIEAVTLGRPVLFSENPEHDMLAERRLLEAARRAGFAETKIQLEPVAACISYIQELKEGEMSNVLVGDFGGGTSDFTVAHLAKTNAQKTFKVLSKGGLYIGGDSFNTHVMDALVAPYFGKDVTYEISMTQRGHLPYWLTSGLAEWHKIPFLNDRKTMTVIDEVRRTADDRPALDRLKYLISGNKGYYIYRAIDDAKIALSNDHEAAISYADTVLALHERIRRDVFEQLIREDVSRLEVCVKKTVEEAGMLPAGVQSVLLTGGSAFVPAVRNVFTRMFPQVATIQLDAFTSVAAGLATDATVQA